MCQPLWDAKHNRHCRAEEVVLPMAGTAGQPQLPCNPGWEASLCWVWQGDDGKLSSRECKVSLVLRGKELCVAEQRLQLGRYTRGLGNMSMTAFVS